MPNYQSLPNHPSDHARIKETIGLFAPQKNEEPHSKEKGMKLALWLDNKIRHFFDPRNALLRIFKQTLGFFHFDILFQRFPRINGFFNASHDLFLRKGLDQPTFDLLVFLFKNDLIDVREHQSDPKIFERWNKISTALEDGSSADFLKIVFNIFDEFNFHGKQLDESNPFDFRYGDLYQQQAIDKADLSKKEKKNLKSNLEVRRHKAKHLKKLIHRWVEHHGDGITNEPGHHAPDYLRLISYRFIKLIGGGISSPYHWTKGKILTVYYIIRKLIGKPITISNQEPSAVSNIEHYGIVNLTKIANLANIERQKKEKSQTGSFYSDLIEKAEKAFDSYQGNRPNKLRLFEVEGHQIRSKTMTYWHNPEIAKLLEQAPGRQTQRANRRRVKKEIDENASFAAKFATFFEVCLTSYSVHTFCLTTFGVAGQFIGIPMAITIGIGTLISNYLLFIKTGQDVGRQLGVENELGVLGIFVDSNGNEISFTRKVIMICAALPIAVGFSVGLIFLEIGAALAIMGLAFEALPFIVTVGIIAAGSYVGLVLSKAFFSVFSIIVRDNLIAKGWQTIRQDCSYQEQNNAYQKQHPKQSLSKIRHGLHCFGRLLALVIITASSILVAVVFSQIMKKDAAQVMMDTFKKGNTLIDKISSITFWISIPGSLIYFFKKLASVAKRSGSYIKELLTYKSPTPSEESAIPKESSPPSVGQMLREQSQSIWLWIKIAVTANTMGEAAVVAKEPIEIPGADFSQSVSQAAQGYTAATSAVTSHMFNYEEAENIIVPPYEQPQSSDLIDATDNCGDLKENDSSLNDSSLSAHLTKLGFFGSGKPIPSAPSDSLVNLPTQTPAY